jgi:proline iminopeptidase
MRKLLRRVLLIVGVLLAALLLACGALFLGSRGDYSVPRTVAQDPSLPKIELDGVVFHAETFGPEGRPVVLVLHGGPGNDYRYLLSLQALSDQYRVVFYDQRGTGLSPRVDPSELTLENMLADVDRMVQRFGKGRPVHIVGHSWGAMLAAAYLGRHPERVQGAVLAEPGMLTSVKAREFELLMKRNTPVRLIGHAALSWFRSLHVSGPDDQARGDFFFLDLFTSAPVELNPLKDYFCDPKDARRMPFWRYSWTSSQTIPNRARNGRGEIEIDLTRGVDKFPRPVLFLCGACDKLIGAEYQKDHLRAFPTARLAIVPRAGHSMFTDNPVESVAIVRSYLSEVAP